MTQEISWNKVKASALIKAHKAAVDREEDSFSLMVSAEDGNVVFNTAYAGYLIEFLGQQGIVKPRKSGDVSDMVHRIKVNLGQKK